MPQRPGGVQPGEEHVVGKVVTPFQGRLLGTKVPGTLAIDRYHLIGQQAQVVLGIGITDAEPQPTLIVGPDMRDTKAGATDLGGGLLLLHPRRGRKTQPQQRPCHTHPEQPVGNNHADSTAKLNTATRDSFANTSVKT